MGKKNILRLFVLFPCCKFLLQWVRLHSLDGLFMWTNKTNKSYVSSWIPPAIAMLKWNVDASSNGKQGPLRIGGGLKDQRFLCIFSCSIGNMDFNEAMILSVKKVMLLSTDYC